MPDLLLPHRDDDSEEIQEAPARRRAAWEYLVPTILVCVLLVVFFPFLLLAATIGVVVLSAGALIAFIYWLWFSKRGIVRRFVRYRNLQARRRNRWLLRAAERGRRESDNPK